MAKMEVPKAKKEKVSVLISQELFRAALKNPANSRRVQGG